MKDNFASIATALLAPIFAALAFDVYLNYFASEAQRENFDIMNVDPGAFVFSDFGYLFIRYIPSVYNMGRDAIDPAQWQMFIDPLFELPTVVVAAIPLLVFLLIAAIMKTFHLGSYSTKSSEAKWMNSAKDGRFVYNKKKKR